VIKLLCIYKQLSMPYVASICLLEYTKSYFAIFTVHLLIYPNKQSFLGVYRNHPGGLSKMFNSSLYSSFNRYWWNSTQLQYIIWGCAWRRMKQVWNISREIIN